MYEEQRRREERIALQQQRQQEFRARMQAKTTPATPTTTITTTTPAAHNAHMMGAGVVDHEESTAHAHNPACVSAQDSVAQTAHRESRLLSHNQPPPTAHAGLAQDTACGDAPPVHPDALTTVNAHHDSRGWQQGLRSNVLGQGPRTVYGQAAATATSRHHHQQQQQAHTHLRQLNPHPARGYTGGVQTTPGVGAAPQPMCPPVVAQHSAAAASTPAQSRSGSTVHHGTVGGSAHARLSPAHGPMLQTPGHCGSVTGVAGVGTHKRTPPTTGAHHSSSAHSAPHDDTGNSSDAVKRARLSATQSCPQCAHPLTASANTATTAAVDGEGGAVVSMPLFAKALGRRSADAVLVDDASLSGKCAYVFLFVCVLSCPSLLHAVTDSSR